MASDAGESNGIGAHPSSIFAGFDFFMAFHGRIFMVLHGPGAGLTNGISIPSIFMVWWFFIVSDRGGVALSFHGTVGFLWFFVVSEQRLPMSIVVTVHCFSRVL